MLFLFSKPYRKPETPSLLSVTYGILEVEYYFWMQYTNKNISTDSPITHSDTENAYIFPKHKEQSPAVYILIDFWLVFWYSTFMLF